MFDLFMMGGPLFMGIITIIFLAGMVVAVRALQMAISDKTGEKAMATTRLLGYVRSVGLLCLVTGILGQMIGLFSAFEAIEQMGSVAPALLAGGLKVSSITTIYGMICFMLFYLLYFGISMLVKGKT